jgi:PAS domain S-box-containing protein
VGNQQQHQSPEPLGKGLTSIIISTKNYLLLGTRQEQIDRGAGNTIGECETYLGVPIMAGRQAVGVLSLQDPMQNRYTADHARLASTIAANLGIALENARLYQEIQAAEERSRLLLDSAGEGIFGMDTSGRMTFVNPAALRMLGFQEQDLIGQDVHQLIHHSNKDGTPYPEADCPMTATCKQGHARQITDEVLWQKDGTCVFVEYASTPIQKGKRLVGAVVTFRDVTERRAADEKLKANLDELERFNRLVVGREEKMIQLKAEINDLMKQMGLEEKYTIIE